MLYTVEEQRIWCVRQIDLLTETVVIVRREVNGSASDHNTVLKHVFGNLIQCLVTATSLKVTCPVRLSGHQDFACHPFFFFLSMITH